MVVVSLSPTPVDNAKNTTKINAACDLVVKTIADHFNAKRRSFKYSQAFKLLYQPLSTSPTSIRWSMRLVGGATNEPPTCVESATITFPSGQGSTSSEFDKSSLDLSAEFTVPSTCQAKLEIHFMELYQRPSLVQLVNLMSGQQGCEELALTFEHNITYDEQGAQHLA